MPSLKLTDCTIGDGAPVLMIAEAGVNHNGDVDIAHQLVDAAAAAGADAIKFQTFITEEIVSPDAPLAGHHLANVGEEMTHFDLLKKIELPWDAHAGLKAHCEDKGVIFISTPYDVPSAGFLVELGCQVIKVASSEMTNLPLLDVLGDAGLPVMLSTGMSHWDEIVESVRFLEQKKVPLCLLKCTSNYPATPASINLRGLLRMREAFPDCVLGLSDHSEGTEVSLAALGLGATVIERHFTLDPEAWGPDHKASLPPAEFKRLVKSIRRVEAAMGDRDWTIEDEELGQRNTMRKGAYARRPISRNERVGLDDVMFLRPKGAIGPKEFFLDYRGRRAVRDIAAGSPLSADSFAKEES